MTDSVNLVLASSSAYRRELLARLGIRFEVAAPQLVEQREPREPPASMAMRLAESKALAVAANRPGALIIAADQVAHLDGEILEKPKGAAAAIRQLTRVAGRRVEFLTAVCVRDGRDGRLHRHLDTTQASFRQLSAQEVIRYVEREPAFDCAGGFRAEALGIALFEKLESEDPTGVIGLPLIATARLLRECGLEIP